MKKFLILISIGIVLLQSCQSGPTMSKQEDIDSLQQVKKAKNPASEKPIKTSDFATKAAVSEIMEVESSAEIIKYTENPDVQTLATIMVKEHLMMSDELSSIVKKLSLKVPTLLPSEKQVKIVKMESIDDEFERNLYYAKMIVNEHEQAVKLYQAGASAETGELQKFAAKLLPRLQLHLFHSKKLLQMLKSIQGDKGDLPLKISGGPENQR